MSEERRCCICQRIVYQGDAHAGYDCANWPEWTKGVYSYAYRGYTVEKIGESIPPVWIYHRVLCVDDREFPNPNDAFAAIDIKLGV